MPKIQNTKNQRNTILRFDEIVKFLYGGCKDSLQLKEKNKSNAVLLILKNYYYLCSIKLIRNEKH